MPKQVVAPAPAPAPAHCVLPPIINYFNDKKKKKRDAAMNLMVVVAVALSLPPHALGQPQENAAEALMRFKTALTNTDPALANWNPSKPACAGNTGNWAGVLCYNGYVWGLQLDNMGLQGQINVDALTGLPYLRTLSFINNNFQGSMPDWRKLAPTLKSLYLSGNGFSGQIPNDAFDGMESLKKVYLSDNKFTGPIPASLASPRMVQVGLDNNQFSGTIPAVDSPNLQLFNVSNNQLQGPVPPSLLKLDPSSFIGNKALCGGPGGPSCDPPKPPPDLEPILHAPPGKGNITTPPPNHKKPSSASPAKIVIIILSVLLALFLLLLLLILCWRSLDDGESETLPKQQQQQQQQQQHQQHGMMRSETASPFSDRSPLPTGAVSVTIGASPSEPSWRSVQLQQASKLSFVRGDRQKFDLQDLMRASAEVLGSGSFGSSYKAVLVDGEALVVKRFKQMNNIIKDDFHDHMKRLGRLKHPNLLPLVAYLYRKEEKLLVFDFATNNSLEKHLHDDGKRQEDRLKPLNWSCRLRAIKGVVKGLAYLYTELPGLNTPHGHLKSSNVLLDTNYNALLMDYTLGPIVNPAQISQALVAYKCPEYAKTSRTSKKSDVWCLGILILETLTGKPVDKFLGHGSKKYGADLARWVKSIVEEANEKGARVFDKNMEMSERSVVEVEKLLHIGIGCCQEDLDKRLDLEAALKKIEQLQE